MIEPYLRRSPLAVHNLVARAAEAPGEAQVFLGERPHRAQINVRGETGDAGFLAAVSESVGVALPVQPNTVGTGAGLAALWLGPNEWLIVGSPGREGGLAARLRDALAGRHAAVTDVSEARTIILVAGPKARDLLSKGTPLDLHPRVFAVGQCAQTALAKANVVLRPTDEAHRSGGPLFEVYILNSFADYLFTWLERAGAEYGVAIAAE